MSKTLIIAEQGINSNRDLTAALKLCDVAKECGADVLKTQLQENDPYTLNRDQVLAVYRHCQDIGLDFACTAFDIPSLKFLLANCSMAFAKIASSDWSNALLLAAANSSGLPVIQSLKKGTYCRYPHWKILHVVPEYPTPLEHCNLARVREVEGWCSGISDHSGNPLIPALAVALGASIVEVHLTLDRDQDGPDHKASLNPAQFKLMVDYVRQAEIACV